MTGQAGRNPRDEGDVPREPAAPEHIAERTPANGRGGTGRGPAPALRSAVRDASSGQQAGDHDAPGLCRAYPAANERGRRQATEIARGQNGSATATVAATVAAATAAAAAVAAAVTVTAAATAAIVAAATATAVEATSAVVAAAVAATSAVVAATVAAAAFADEQSGQKGK